MSRQQKFSQLGDFADRLRATRKAMGLNQAEFAALGGVVMNSQNRYEAAATEPSMSYLASLAAAGVDVGFLLSGEGSGGRLSADETDLLGILRIVGSAERDAALVLLRAAVRNGASDMSSRLVPGSDSALHDRRPSFRSEADE